MESQLRENEDTPTCLAMVPYTGVTSIVSTYSMDDGFLALTRQVHQVPKFTLERCVDKLRAWSNVELWRVAGQGTTEKFWEDGPFTRIKENGRPADRGNLVVLSYFKVVVKTSA